MKSLSTDLDRESKGWDGPDDPRETKALQAVIIFAINMMALVGIIISVILARNGFWDKI